MPQVSGRGIVSAAISAGVVLATSAGFGSAAAAAQQAPAAASPRAAHIIMVLRSQNGNMRRAAHVSANRSSQAPLLAHARSVGARNLHGFGLINAVAATVTPAQEAKLASDPSVARIFADLPISAGPSVRKQISTAAKGKVSAAADDQQICPSNPSKPLLEPEALQLTHTAFSDPSTPQAQNIVTGAGVSVGFIADGLDINNPDFIRTNGQHVFTDYQDFSGDGLAAVTGGAEAFGDASAIAAQGHQVYDLSQFVNPAHPLPPGCNITVRGMAPGASLVGLKVFGNSNTAPTSRFIQAIDYAVNVDHVNVLNESFGGNPFPDSGDDPISLADKAAVDAGVTVVSSTGDAGTNGTIGTPSSDPFVISAAGSTMFRSYIQTTNAGAQFSNGHFVSNNISGLSSGGTTQQGRVPDVIAPGDLGWALCTPDLALYEECTSDAGGPSPIQDFGGTSQSSPLTAGEAALVIQAYRNTHHGASPSPAVVKKIITGTASDLDHPAFEQGSGLINSLAAVQAAESWRDGNGRPAAVGSSLVSTPSQLTAIGHPGAPAVQRLSVRNVSNHPEVVHATTRTVGHTVSSVNGTDQLNTATAPAFLDAFGISRSFVEDHFTVRPGVDRLDVSNAASLPDGFSIRIILLDPSGVYTAYSIPQGFNNFSHVDVHHPVAGRWTIISAASTSSGFNGPVLFNVTQSDFTRVGVVAPAVQTIAPGRTGTFVVAARLPSSPSDQSASVQLSSSDASASVPLTLRAVIPPRNTSFTTTITGGNGRQQLGPAQTNIYYLDVPRGARDVTANFSFQDPNQVVLATLTAPDGQVYSFKSNTFTDAAGNLNLANGLSIIRRDPQPGRWVLSLDVTNPVSGGELSQQATVHVQYNSVRVSQTGLPNSARTHLAAGTPVNVPVQVTNTGTLPLTFFADPRLKAQGTLSLEELTGNATVPLPMPAGIVPQWLDPTETTQFALSVSADQPVNVDMNYNSGEPELYAPAAANPTVDKVTAAQVSPGIWTTNIGQTGPFSGPAPAGTAQLSATAVGRLFDTNASSTTGDIWTAGVTGQSAALSAAVVREIRANSRDASIVLHGGRVQLAHGGSVTAAASSKVSPADTPPPPTGPITLNPGQTGTITVTITPSGASGTVVHGTLYIDNFDFFTEAGDELAALPYAYTIK
jgi:hypothetical protein